MIRLGCVDAFLKLMLPSNPNADAVIYALSLIADEADSIFPREQTINATCKMLETLRGAAKRSKNASATGFLIASLVKSPIFHGALCTESNLSILSKLLVGGSTEVLCATAFALGVVCLHALDSTKELFFKVDGAANLMKLVSSADEKVARLSIFALAAAFHDGTILACCSDVYPDAVRSDSLRSRMLVACNDLIMSDTYRPIYDRAIVRLSIGSVFAARIMSCLSFNDQIKNACCNEDCVDQLLSYTSNTNSAYLGTYISFFLENSSIIEARGNKNIESLHWTSDRFCAHVESNSSGLDILCNLFDIHQPDRLFGLPSLFSNFVRNSSSLKKKLSSGVVIDHVLSAVTRLNHPALNDQVLTFLDDLTQLKNNDALTVLFAHDPDRVANLLHSSLQRVQLRAATILRRLFKRLNSKDIPSNSSKRQLVKLMAVFSDHPNLAIAACRVWGNLLQYEDQRQAFAKLANSMEVMLMLLHQSASEFDNQVLTSVKNLHVTIRSLYRASQCEDVRKVMVSASHFLSIVTLFMCPNENIMNLAYLTMCEIARSPGLRKHLAVPAVLNAVYKSIRDRDPVFTKPYKVNCLEFAGILAKKEPAIQNLLIEHKIVDAVVQLLQSPLVSLEWEILKEALEALAWFCSGVQSPARRIIATSKMVDLALRHVDSSRDLVASASLHLLQRMSSENDVKGYVEAANGASIIMRALSMRNDHNTRRRACCLIRNLVQNHDGNRREFQQLGVNNFIVSLIVSCQNKERHLKLQIAGLQVISALCFGTNSIAKLSKQECVECEDSSKLILLVASSDNRQLCAAWCHALAMMTHGSPSNAKSIVEAGIVPLLIQFLLAHKHVPLQINSAQLLAYLAAVPENRSRIMKDGAENLFIALIGALHTDHHDLQRYTALFIANLATRNEENKVKLGASGVVSPLIDRLSSKQLNVLENVLQAVMKLGSHPGNKVKFGCKVCFEKLLALVHHEELAIRKSAVSTIAVLIEGNDVNKKFLLQCEASVVTELCAMLKSTNGKVVESAMLIIGELSVLPDQTLEISKYIDILAIVRMLEHVNIKIKGAALNTVLNLTKESFNKLRFGIQECIDALLKCLGAEELTIVELAVTCLGNLSFIPVNAMKIAQSSSLMILLKLAAASTTSTDYLTWNESRQLQLGKTNTQSEEGTTKPESPKKSSEVEDDAEDEAPNENGESSIYTNAANGEDDSQVLDFSSFPSRQTAVLEQTVLIISNCAHDYHEQNLVEKVAIKVVCQALHHASELVKRCACYIIALWCKRDPINLELATKRGIIPLLIQMINSPNLQIVEAAMYALAKLSYYADNHIKMLNLDLLNTLIQNILRRSAYLTHAGLLDRSLRLLGTLACFPKIRQNMKSEEIISDILTSMLQIQRVLAKNITRLILVMLEEESLKFFLPKKTVMLLRAIFTDKATEPKTVRNILRIFDRIAVVEEHKTTIALEDSGESLIRMVHELYSEAEIKENLLLLPSFPPNASTVLSLLAGISSAKKIAIILSENDIYAILPQYLMVLDISYADQGYNVPTNAMEKPKVLMQLENLEQDPLQINIHATTVTKNLCTIMQDHAVQRLSDLDVTRFMVLLLRNALKTGGLTQLSFECACVIEKMCANTHDQHILYQEAAVEVLVSYFSIWLNMIKEMPSVIDSTTGNPLTHDGPELLKLAKPLAHIILNFALDSENRILLMNENGISLLLEAMAVAVLTENIKECLVRTVTLLTRLPMAKECFDGQDVVSPLFKFMVAHQANRQLLLYSLCAFSDIMELSSSSRHRILSHPTALSFFLQCLKNAKTDQEDKIHFAINILECLSTEKKIAESLAPLEGLSLVPKLLLLPMEKVTRETQYFATQMIGYMTYFGHVEKLKLEEDIIARIISFAAFHEDEHVTSDSIGLALWTLAQLATSVMSITVCKWIVDDSNGLDVLIKCGIFQSKDIVITSPVVANALNILNKIVHVDGILTKLASKHVCTPLARLLESVEKEIRLPALEILSMLLPIYDTSSQSTAQINRQEQWPVILNSLLEWMEVYARDISSCALVPLSHAYRCLSLITPFPPLASEFTQKVVRTGLADIIAGTLHYFSPHPQENGSQDQGGRDKTEDIKQTILLHAMRICLDLMASSSVYIDKLMAHDVSLALENIIILDDRSLVLETLNCMNYLGRLRMGNDLLFSSATCVSRLKKLLKLKSPQISAKITPLFALMCARMPDHPELCSLDGLDVITMLLELDWNNRNDFQEQITEDACAMLLSMFSSHEQIFTLYDQATIIDKLFRIVLEFAGPELPFRVLVKISNCIYSHPRFMDLFKPLSDLLDDESSLDVTSQNFVLCILFNIFCHSAELGHVLPILEKGQHSVLLQLLPLSRWVRVPNADSVRMVLEILHTFLSTPNFQTLFNNGSNVPAILSLISHDNEVVSVVAAQLLLTASSERDVQIAITVEDGIASLVQTLRKTNVLVLQRLILIILRNMSYDSEIQVLIVNEEGIPRLLQFIQERNAISFASEERLALSCEILRQLSGATTAAKRVIDANGHACIMELSAQQNLSEVENERVVTMEILCHLAHCATASAAVVEAGFVTHFLRYALSLGSEKDIYQSQMLALDGLRALCSYSKQVRADVGSNEEFVLLLEAYLISKDAKLNHIAMSLLRYISAVPVGCQSIFKKASSGFILSICAIMMSPSIKLAEPPSWQANNVSSTENLVNPVLIDGTKLLGCVLNDPGLEQCRTSWQYESLASLTGLLEKLLSNHTQPKLQLKGLQIIRGSYSDAFYFSLTPRMLSDILNILLISPSQSHCAHAESIIVKAFNDTVKVHSSIGGNQILEQLLIVVTQKIDPKDRCALFSSLTQVLYISITKKFIVNQRFISKILTLLNSFPSSINTEFTPIEQADTESSVDDTERYLEDEKSLIQALCIYLSYVYKVSMASALQQNIREVVRTEINAPVLDAILKQVLTIHTEICPYKLKRRSASNLESIINDDEPVDTRPVLRYEEVLVWNFFADAIYPIASHLELQLLQSPFPNWLCLVQDVVAQIINLPQESDMPGIVETGTTVNAMPSQEDTLVGSLKILSAFTSVKSVDTDQVTEDFVRVKTAVCELCLDVLWTIPYRGHALLERGLSSLLDVRSGWGEKILITAFNSFPNTNKLLHKILQVFRAPGIKFDRARHLLLQLILVLVSTGTLIEELKAANIRELIESNEHIVAADKPTTITVLTLLGYNADLKGEFSLALQRFEEANEFIQQKESLSYLTTFLQLYALADEALQERAINCIMRQLVSEVTPEPTEIDPTKSLTSECIICLMRLAAGRNFVELYLRKWDLNSLLAIAFNRKRGNESNDFKELPRLDFLEINQLLQVSTLLYAYLASVGAMVTSVEDIQIDRLLVLATQLGSDQATLVEQVLSLIYWLINDYECFMHFEQQAGNLQVFLQYITQATDTNLTLLRIFDKIANQATEIQNLDELLEATLTYVYANATKLNRNVRDKLLLFILFVMKRMGEDGLSGSPVYEKSIQRILTNLHANVELVARCSWDLLGMLTEFDPAVTTIFNFDGIPILIRECCSAPTSKQELLALGRNAKAHESYRIYKQMEALKCLSKSARTRDEVLTKIGEAPEIAQFLFRALAKTHEFVDESNVSGPQEHSSHLIARIASQEYLRASLLSQEHIAMLIESLESVHLSVILNSLEALYYMCEFAMCLDALVRHATVPVLGQILFSPLAAGDTQEKTEQFVLGLLGNMCSKSKTVCRRVVSSNLLAKMKSFLVSSRKMIHYHAVWVIRSLSVEPELVPKLNDYHILETLCNCLQNYDPGTTQRKAFGAVAKLIELTRKASLSETLLRTVTRHTVATLNENIPMPTLQRAVGKALSVFEAIASQEQFAKDLLVEEQAIQVTISLFGAADSRVKLRALNVVAKWIDDNSDINGMCGLFSESALLSLVRAISEDVSDVVLAALGILNALLLMDDALRSKLASMTYELLLRVVATHVSNTNPSATQKRVLSEALKSLVAMTKGGKLAPSTSSAILGCLDSLIRLLRGSESDNVRINALYLLVNFASSIELRPRMIKSGAMSGLASLFIMAKDEKIVQLCLLGMALLTAVDFSAVVGELLSTVDKLVDVLSSKNASVQANAVWVLSNISTDGKDRLCLHLL